MTLIGIAERGQDPDGAFRARVSFADGGEYEVTVTNPLDADQEKCLAWYFEEHLRYPFLDHEVARKAVQDLRACGLGLFEQVFAGPALPEYRSWARHSFDKCRIQVQGSAAFHRLHWEALRDPESENPLALRMPLTRRVDGMAARFEVADPGDTLNILVVTARPDGPRDVGYRTVSRPLLDGVRQADRPVRIELVRPGTWAALRERLRQATREHGSGYFHVVHFDVHGALAGYDEMEQGRKADRYLFGDAGEKYDGERGFLFFETAELKKAHPVSADQVAQLLAEHRVPVAVLNACQSAKESASEASLAQRLVDAGVPVAVGMAYSVTVTAAEQAMPVLYDGLSRGLSPVDASFEARRSLADRKARQGYFDQQLDLEDWVLPVVFAQRPLEIPLREMSTQRQTDYYNQLAQIADEPSPDYGFVGRDLDIHALERALLLDPDQNMALVQGLAGAGKSTLLAHLQWWWRRTGLVEDAFVFSYEERAWNTTHIVRDIASKLLDPVAFAQHELMGLPAQIQQVAGLLKARRYVLVLDNIESITGSHAAIPHSLPEESRTELAGFLSQLRGGRTLVVFGSREAEDWLAPHAFEQNVYRLPGLDGQAASVLVHRILSRHGGAHHESDPEQREALKELVGLLGGYPLPLTVVLPMLNTRTPAQVLADLREGSSEADPVGLITKAIEYSHGKLDPITQRSLLLLAPFTGTIPAPALQNYAEALTGQEAVTALGPFDLDAAVAEIIRVGLAAPHLQLQGWVQLLPVLPYFLRTRLANHPGLAAALSQAHYALYTSLGPAINRMLTSRQPDQRRLGHVAARAEYANLGAAIQHALSTAQPVLPVLRPVEELLDQTKQQPARRRLLDLALAADRPADLRREQADLHHLVAMVAQEQRRFADPGSTVEVVDNCGS